MELQRLYVDISSRVHLIFLLVSHYMVNEVQLAWRTGGAKEEREKGRKEKGEGEKKKTLRGRKKLHQRDNAYAC